MIFCKFRFCPARLLLIGLPTNPAKGGKPIVEESTATIMMITINIMITIMMITIITTSSIIIITKTPITITMSGHNARRPKQGR